jgi:dipeptidase
MGCDTLVALASATRDRVTLFAKNSDRPPGECQRVVQLPRKRHPPGARVRCQYLEVAEVEETSALIGSQPYWLWGLEHGVNEHRVAIGNETVFAKEALGSRGLIGMDLVRLGLERSRSAEEALAVITRLIERHGQGGSGHARVDWPYHNAFLIADPTSAWIVETSDRHWAARRVSELGNVSNGLALDSGWERGSADLTEFAVARGWWPRDAGRVDFARAYADDTGVPPNLCRARRERAAALLATGRGGLTAGAMRSILRDHYDGGPIHRRHPLDHPQFFSLCMHADPLDNTTAAIVAPLPAEPAAITPVWVCLGSPCTGAFLPCFLEGHVPAILASGGAEPEQGAPWWRMREILSLVERDFERMAPRVQQTWGAFEAALVEEAAAVGEEATAARLRGRNADAVHGLTAFMERTVARYLELAEALVREIAAEA